MLKAPFHHFVPYTLELKKTYCNYHLFTMSQQAPTELTHLDLENMNMLLRLNICYFDVHACTCVIVWKSDNPVVQDCGSGGNL